MKTVPPSRGEWQRVKRIAADAWAQPPDDRVRYAIASCGDDEPLRAEVLSLLDSMIDAGDRFETPVFAFDQGIRVPASVITASPPVAAGQRVGAWTIIRQLGEGGMGTVYLAERAETGFRQRAAVKIVRGGGADTVLLRRFDDERRILATLEHPHIARLIDGGTTELGLPYVVMEYVEGRPVDAYCRAGGLDARQRLEVFRLICLAVHYAHQRLVVHRDLKPSNILVTSDGTPKLLDFGIAKIVATDERTDATRTLFRILTPESASPEQLRGEAITTATDIYALGVLLYRLLTGRSPYRTATNSETELIRAVCEQTPEAPSASPRGDDGLDRQRGIDRDLDRIVLMALRKEPDRRYSTAEQFAEDVRRYLDGRPVLAAPDSARYRAKKFVGRNRVAVGAAAGFLLALVGGLVAITWEARAARQERDRALHEFNAVHRLAGSVLGELHDAVVQLPGSLAARELLIRRATEYLDALLADAARDAGLRRELALGYARLGQIQGRAGSSNVGNHAAARRSYERSVALFESLDPRMLTLSDAGPLSDAYTELARTDTDANARAAHRRGAQVLAERFLRENPKSAQALALAIGYWNTLALDQERAKDYQAALHSFTSIAHASETMLELTPDDQQLAQNLSITYRKIGTENELLGARDEALVFHEKARALAEQWLARAPRARVWRLDLSFSHAAIGTVLANKGDLPAAIEHHRRAVALRREVADADQNDEFAKDALARGYDRLAGFLGRAGHVEDAIQAYVDRVAVLERWRVAHADRDNAWRDVTSAAFDAARKCLDLLVKNPPASRVHAARVRGMLARVVDVQNQWSRDKRAGVLAPSAAQLDEAMQQLAALRVR